MKTTAENLAALISSEEYKRAAATYSNAFKNGAGRSGPKTMGFLLWLLYDIYFIAHNKKAPTKQLAQAMARAHGLNETSAENALRKWSAHNGLIRPRTGNYSIGRRS